MKEDQSENTSSPLPSYPYISVLLAWILPGLGHFYLNRKKKAVVFFLLVVFSLTFGLALNGKVYKPKTGKILSYMGTFACLGIGPIYGVLKMTAGNTFGDATSVTFEYGNAFILTSGLMNILLIIDAFDIAAGRK